MTEADLKQAVTEGATLLAVYRRRDDGDGDFIAAFDIQNCREFFADNAGEGAERLVTLVQEGLTFDNEASIWVGFKHPGEIVDVLEGAQAIWEKQHTTNTHETPHF